MNAYDDMINKGLVELESISRIRKSLERKIGLVLSQPYDLDFRDNLKGYYQAGGILDGDLADPRAFNSECALLADNISNRLN